MPKTITLTLSPKQAADEATYLDIAARRAGISTHNIALARILKRSVDDRGQSVKVNPTIEPFLDGE